MKAANHDKHQYFEENIDVCKGLCSTNLSGLVALSNNNITQIFNK